MMMSSALSNGASSAMLASTTAAGNISQMARGVLNLFTKSGTLIAGVMPSFASVCTASLLRSNTTH